MKSFLLRQILLLVISQCIMGENASTASYALSKYLAPQSVSKKEQDYMVKELNAFRSKVVPGASNMRYVEYKRDKILEQIATHYVTLCSRSESAMTFLESDDDRYYGVIADNTTEGIMRRLNKGKGKYTFKTATCTHRDNNCTMYWEAVVAEASHFFCKKGKHNTRSCRTVACALEIDNRKYKKGKTPYQEGEQCSLCSAYPNYDKCLDGLCATEDQCKSRSDVTCTKANLEEDEEGSELTKDDDDEDKDDEEEGSELARPQIDKSRGSMTTAEIAVWLLSIHMLLNWKI